MELLNCDNIWPNTTRFILSPLPTLHKLVNVAKDCTHVTTIIYKITGRRGGSLKMNNPKNNPSTRCKLPARPRQIIIDIIISPLMKKNSQSLRIFYQVGAVLTRQINPCDTLKRHHHNYLSLWFHFRMSEIYWNLSVKNRPILYTVSRS